MVKINRIYTRTGDDGTTGLIGGERVQKDSLRVQGYGDVDELNSFLGMCRTMSVKANLTRLVECIAEIQNDLFDIGSQLALPPGSSMEGIPDVSVEHSRKLEGWIDELIDGVPELRSFVLPGGSELNSALHIARSVCRRAERNILSLSREEPVPSPVLVYLNRLSDLLFAMARYSAHKLGEPEYLWTPGKPAK
jgi:cob(I)alamin adenosyltransferase